MTNSSLCFGWLRALVHGIMAVAVWNSFAWAGGSIVINNSAPSEDLVLTDESGGAQALNVSWSDIQVLDGLRKRLFQEFGPSSRSIAYVVDTPAQVVRFVNPRTGADVILPFNELRAAAAPQ